MSYISEQCFQKLLSSCCTFVVRLCSLLESIYTVRVRKSMFTVYNYLLSYYVINVTFVPFYSANYKKHHSL